MIILIETSTSLCTCAICDIHGKILASRRSETPRSQASLTAPFVDGMLRELGVRAPECSAVCVSSGPGSYTGLRVGVSTAKGLCFGAGIPLISVSTLDTLVEQAYLDGLVPEGCRYIVPMVDARRMEVYTAVYEGRLRKGDVAPVIVDGDFFNARGIDPSDGVLIIGDGALKCKELLGVSGVAFEQCCPRADAMAGLAARKLGAGEFENVAYFEPFYLKEFVATVSKKSLF